VRVVAQPSDHFGEGGGLDGDGDGLVAEGGMPPWGKTGEVGFQVACVGMEEWGWPGPRTVHRPRSGSRKERPTSSVPSVVGSGLEAVGSGGEATSVGSSKVKRGSGKRSI
jgi:hypothetical protein